MNKKEFKKIVSEAAKASNKAQREMFNHYKTLDVSSMPCGACTYPDRGYKHKHKCALHVVDTIDTYQLGKGKHKIKCDKCGEVIYDIEILEDYKPKPSNPNNSKVDVSLPNLKAYAQGRTDMYFEMQDEKGVSCNCICHCVIPDSEYAEESHDKSCTHCLSPISKESDKWEDRFNIVWEHFIGREVKREKARVFKEFISQELSTQRQDIVEIIKQRSLAKDPVKEILEKLDSLKI